MRPVLIRKTPPGCERRAHDRRMATLPHLVLAAISLWPLHPAQEEEGSEKRELVLRAEGAFEGYTLFSPLNSKMAVWSYSAAPEFFSAFISGAERLANGNTLICSGVQGRIFEVTREGRIVWEYLNPFGGDVKTSPQAGNSPPTALFRATRIAKDHPGLAKHGL